MNCYEIDKTLAHRKEELEKILLRCDERLRSSPEGRLRISSCKGHAQYYHCLSPGRKRNYIKDGPLPKQLAQKSYDQSVVKSAKAELDAVNRLAAIRKKCPESLYEQLHIERQKLVIPVRKTDEQFVREWSELKYNGKGFTEDAPELITDRGERVRSKSEVIIANLLLRRNIPYRYEYPLSIRGVGTFYPDFLVLNVRLRKEFIHEHFGMMDYPDYAEKAIGKILIYERAGIFPGERLIITSETRQNPINMRNLNLLIEKFYL